MTATASLHPAPDPPGRSRLWSVFWLQGVIPSNILWAVALWALANGRTPLLLGVFAALLLYTGWIIPAVCCTPLDSPAIEVCTRSTTSLPLPASASAFCD